MAQPIIRNRAPEGNPLKPAKTIKVSPPAPGEVKPFALPTEKSAASMNMNDHSWLIYGAKKIGKTSLACQFPGHLLFSFEPASKSVEAYKVDCPTWDAFLGYIAELESATHEFKTVIIDTGYEAYYRCMEYVCGKNHIEHPGAQNDFGASWSKVTTEFRKAHLRLAVLGLGMIVVFHETLKDSETLAGQKFDMVLPNWPSQAENLYRAIIDNVVHYHYRGKDRFLLVRGSDYATAGVAMNFKTPEGEDIYAVPGGTSAQDAFEYLGIAFTNEQQYPFKDETDGDTQEKLADSMRKKLRNKKQR